MKRSQTDRDWEWFGRHDPYFGVVSWDAYRRDNLDADAKEVFFRQGEEYVERLAGQMARLFGDGVAPRRVLDFGCGVGRLVIPFARRYAHVLGVDVSPSMLRRAREHCLERAIDNAEFLETGAMGGVAERFDLVHSFIVFQHIPVAEGYGLTRRLIGLLAPGGIGVLHYVYGHYPTESRRSRWLMWAYRRVPFAYRIRRLWKREPVMQMNEYDTNRILAEIQDAGCEEAHLRFTDHGCRGVVILFRKGCER